MKIALYIEDGLEQIVLTPESDTETAILGKLHDGSRSLSIKRGGFYGCQGGWMRQKVQRDPFVFTSASASAQDESTMIVLRSLASPEGVAATPNDTREGAGPAGPKPTEIHPNPLKSRAALG